MAIDKKRVEELARIAYSYLKMIEDSEHADALSMTLHYDGANCDGSCLKDDLAIALGIDED